MSCRRALTVALVPALFLGGCAGDEPAPPRASTSTVYRTERPVDQSRNHLMYKVGETRRFDGLVNGLDRAQEVTTPEGTWRFVAGDAQQDITTKAGSRYLTQSGMRLLPVAFTFIPRSATASSSSGPRRMEKTTFTLRWGKESRKVGWDPTSPGQLVTVLPQSVASGSLTMDVTFAGVTQSVDLSTGTVTRSAAAAGLYDGLSGRGQADCPLVRNDFTGKVGLKVASTCGLVSVNRFAWRQDTGWAPANRVFVELLAIVNPSVFEWRNEGGSVSTYDVATSVSAATFDGQPAKVTKKGNSYRVVGSVKVGSASTALRLTEKVSGKNPTGARTGKPGSDPKLLAPSTMDVTQTVTSTVIWSRG